MLSEFLQLHFSKIGNVSQFHFAGRLNEAAKVLNNFCDDSVFGLYWNVYPAIDGFVFTRLANDERILFGERVSCRIDADDFFLCVRGLNDFVWTAKRQIRTTTNINLWRGIVYRIFICLRGLDEHLLFIGRQVLSSNRLRRGDNGCYGSD